MIVKNLLGLLYSIWKKIPTRGFISRLHYTFANCCDLTKIRFNDGEVDIAQNAFENVEATVYYPASSNAWTSSKRQNYGGTLIWVGTSWQKNGGIWYYFNSKGQMVTGWQCLGNSWYYFNSSGQMQTGWHYIDNK